MVSVNLGNASTNVTDGALHIGVGTTADVDTRPDYIVTNTSGTFLFTGVLRNFRNVTMTSACTINGEIECELLTQASCDIENAVIRTNSVTSVACLQDPTFGSTTDLNNTEFIQAGAGHALEIDSAGTYSLVGLKFTGYGATGNDDAAIDITASSGTVTLNISGGGDTPTYKTAGATVVINNPTDFELTNLIAGSEVRICEAGTQTELAGTESSGTTFTYQYNYVSDQDIDYIVMHNDYEVVRRRDTLTNQDKSIRVEQETDRVYNNP